MLTGVSPSQRVKALLALHLNGAKYIREGSPTAVRSVDVDHKPRIGWVPAFEGPDSRLRPFVCDSRWAYAQRSLPTLIGRMIPTMMKCTSRALMRATIRISNLKTSLERSISLTFAFRIALTFVPMASVNPVEALAGFGAIQRLGAGAGAQRGRFGARALFGA